MNVGLYSNWKFAQRLILTSGIDITHYFNGNTEFSNVGLNAAGLKMGLLYDISKPEPLLEIQKDNGIVPEFPEHISWGIGANVLHKEGDLRGTYQTLALKMSASRSSFLHIGYNLKDFREPNYLMLGLRYRFNNRTPSLLSVD